ncbi:MAG: aryl-sulfate sulfotransferase [Alphaproteobacteria bacterium]|nr:aryl-sulfate sulfotransferase [Alphaproteobacteria bacterium]
MTVAPGPLTNQLALTVDLASPAAVAAWCFADDAPDDEHLVEVTTPSTHHELRVMGLLSNTAYTCRVAPTCPTGGPAVEVHHATTAPSVRLPVLDVEVDATLGMTGTWTLGPWQANLGAPTWLVIWGPDGRPRWWWRLDPGVQIGVEALLEPGTTTILYGGGEDPDGAPTLVDLWEGTVWRATPPSWGSDQYSHDTKRLPDGRILTLQYVPNRQGARTWLGFGIRVLDPATSTVDVQLESQRYVSEGLLPPGDGDEPYHANWVDWKDTPAGPVVYVSLYREQRIWALDATTGDLLWDLGAGRGWTVLDENGDPLPDGALPQGQHGLEVDGDRLWVYDNGVQRLQSRAERWHVDATTHTATREWVWTEPGWYEPVVGDIDVLPGGRVLLTQGTLGTGRQRITEVDLATGQVASRMSTDALLDTGYRSERYDGCALFASVAACPALRTRLDEVRPLLEAP